MMDEAFPIADRQIFGPVSWDGVNVVYLDPSRVQRRLDQAVGGRIAELLEQWASPEPAVALAAAEQFLGAVRVAFDAAPFDPATGSGATEVQLRQVWDAWLAWNSKKNESTPPCPTGWPPTAGRLGSP